MGNFRLKIVLTVVMLIFAIVPAAIVGTVGTFSIVNYESSVKENTLKLVSESKSAGVTQLFSSYTSTVSAVSHTVAAIDAAKGSGSAGNIMSAAVSSDADMLDMLILDKNGTVIEAVNSSTGGVFENLPKNDQGVINMSSVSPVLSWTGYGEQQTDAIYVSSPITDEEAASGVVGYVAAIYSASPESMLVRSVSGSISNPANGFFMLVDSNGVAVNFNKSGSVDKTFADGDLWNNSANGMSRYFDEGNSDYSDLKMSNDIKSVRSGAGGFTYYLGLPGKDIKNWRWAGVAPNGSFGSFAMTSNLLGWVVAAASAVVFSVASLIVIGKFLGNMKDN